MANRFQIRPASTADLQGILAVERASFSDPWSREAFADAVREAVLLVAVNGDEVVGFLLARRVADEAEVMDVAVAPAMRRRGVARALLEEACSKLAEAGARAVFLEVRVSNHAARGLYLDAGFTVVGRRPRYYRSPVEDGLLMRRLLGGAS